MKGREVVNGETAVKSRREGQRRGGSPAGDPIGIGETHRALVKGDARLTETKSLTVVVGRRLGINNGQCRCISERERLGIV